MKRYTLGKSERLKSKKELARLFESGKSFSTYPLRLIWRIRDDDQTSSPVQFAVSVPKRKFSKAVERNRIKRQIREAYRLNKPLITDALERDDHRLSFFIIYVAKESFPYSAIEKAMQQLIRRFLKKWEKTARPANPSG